MFVISYLLWLQVVVQHTWVATSLQDNMERQTTTRWAIYINQLTWHAFGGGRRAEYPEKTHADKRNTERQPGIEIGTFLLWGATVKKKKFWGWTKGTRLTRGTRLFFSTDPHKHHHNWELVDFSRDYKVPQSFSVKSVSDQKVAVINVKTTSMFSHLRPLWRRNDTAVSPPLPNSHEFPTSTKYHCWNIYVNYEITPGLTFLLLVSGRIGFECFFSCINDSSACCLTSIQPHHLSCFPCVLRWQNAACSPLPTFTVFRLGDNFCHWRKVHGFTTKPASSNLSWFMRRVSAEAVLNLDPCLFSSKTMEKWKSAEPVSQRGYVFAC